MRQVRESSEESAANPENQKGKGLREMGAKEEEITNPAVVGLASVEKIQEHPDSTLHTG